MNKNTDQALRGCPKCEHTWFEDLSEQAKQGEHSALPWSEQGGIITAGISPGQPYIADCRFGPLANREANAKLIVASVNHAQALAEALENIEANLTGRDNFAERVQSSLRYCREALQAWEGAQ